MKFKPIFYLIIVSFLVSCSGKQEVNVDVSQIPELIDYYESIMQMAKEWSPDAYLYDVDIPLGKKPWLLSAGFYSPTKNDESFEVLLDLQGELMGRRFSQEFGVVQVEPILRSQWQLGSREAFRILVSQNIDVIENISDLCGSLMLNRGTPLPGKPLVWKLIPHECNLLISSDNFYLDPISGKVIIP